MNQNRTTALIPMGKLSRIFLAVFLAVTLGIPGGLAFAEECSQSTQASSSADSSADGTVESSFTATYKGSQDDETPDALAASDRWSSNDSASADCTVFGADSTLSDEAQPASTGTNLTDQVNFDLKSLKFAGTEYAGGDVELKPDASVSYEFTWGPIPDSVSPQEGDYLDVEIFRIKGMSFTSQTDRPMNINVGGRVIRIGTWSLNYNKSTGVFSYHVEFNGNAQTFSGIAGSSKGSGKFGSDAREVNISVLGEDKGTATILEVTTPINPPSTDATGVGWSAPKVPAFSTTTYGFGKALKWAGTDTHQGNTLNALEWRAGYMSLLQEKSNQFFEDNTDVDASTGAITLTADA